MPIVASDIIEVAITGRWTNGEDVTNVLHFRMDAEVGDVDIEAEVEDIVQNWQSQLMDVFPNNYTLIGANWVDLRSLDGETGFVGPVEGETSVGLVDATVIPPSNSVLARKRISGGRTKRSGRMYLPPPPTNIVDENGNLQEAYRASYETALGNWLANVTQGGVGEATNRYLVVLHGDASYSEVTGLEVQPLLATQRGRQR